MRKRLTLNDVSIRRRFTALLINLFLIQGICLLPSPPVRAESAAQKGSTESATPHLCLTGTWLRSDGGYLLKLSEVGTKGRLKAEYFNPRRINVAKAEWHQSKSEIQVLVELRDVNYPGSTYTLLYVPKTDTLEGKYYQALEGHTYDISFVRAE